VRRAYADHLVTSKLREDPAMPVELLVAQDWRQRLR
jgi:hypothetical protein